MTKPLATITTEARANSSVVRERATINIAKAVANLFKMPCEVVHQVPEETSRANPRGAVFGFIVGVAGFLGIWRFLGQRTRHDGTIGVDELRTLDAPMHQGLNEQHGPPRLLNRPTIDAAQPGQDL